MRQISCITMFSVASIATVTRTVLRLYFQKRLSIDDGFLVIAILLASVCMGLLVNFVDSMYLVQRSNEGRIHPDLSEIEVASKRWHLLSDIFVVLSWTIEYGVKFSYLFLFKILIRRIHAMEVYWRCKQSFKTASLSSNTFLSCKTCAGHVIVIRCVSALQICLLNRKLTSEICRCHNSNDDYLAWRFSWCFRFLPILWWPGLYY